LEEIPLLVAVGLDADLAVPTMSSVRIAMWQPSER
jgi:hypothetical protein